jgi:hypothetical protein
MNNSSSIFLAPYTKWAAKPIGNKGDNTLKNRK